MGLYFIIDIIIICLAIGIVINGWRTGLVSSIVRLVGAIAAYAGAWIFSGPISNIIYKGFVSAKMLRFAEGLVPPDLQKMADAAAAMGVAADDFSGIVSQQVANILGEYGLDNLPFGLLDADKTGGEITGRVMEKGYSIAEALTETVLQPLATTVLRVVIFVVIFWVLSLLVKALYHVGFGFNHLPLLGGVNRLLGAAVGVLEAVIIIYIICMALAIASMLFGGRVDWLSWQELQNAKLFSMIVDVKPPAGLGIL